MNRARIAAALVSGLALAGCTRTETDEQIVRTYDAYSGPAPYPNQRPKLTPDSGFGMTSDNGSDTVTVLDLAGGKVLGSAPVGRNPVDNDGPHHLAIDPKKGMVYVALAYPAPAFAPGPHAAHGSSTQNGFAQRLALDDLRPLGDVRVDPNPGDIVLSEDGSRLVISHFDLQKAAAPGTLDERRAGITVIDPDKILDADSPNPVRIKTCVAPHGVALSRPDGKTAFVACYGEDAIAIVDVTASDGAIQRVPIGPGAGPPGAPAYGPYSAVPSPDADRIAIGDTESADVRMFDTATKSMTTFVAKTMGAPYFPAWSSDAALLYTPTQGPDALLVIDTATGETTTSRTFDDACIKPHEAVLSVDGMTLYVVCEGDHQAPGAVLALDPVTLEDKASFEVGVYPDCLALVPAQ